MRTKWYLFKNVLMAFVVTLGVSSCTSTAPKTNTVPKPDDQSLPQKKESPTETFNDFLKLGNTRQHKAMYSMLTEECKHEIGTSFRANLRDMSSGASQYNRLKNLDDFAVFQYFITNTPTNRTIILSEEKKDDSATLQTISADQGGYIGINDINLVKKNATWKINGIHKRDLHHLPRNPTVSPSKVYSAFLTFRDRGDYDAAYDLIEENSRKKYVKIMRAYLMPFARNEYERQSLSSWDDRTIFIKIIGVSIKDSVNIISEKVTGTAALLGCREEKKGHYSDIDIPMVWKSGIWRILVPDNLDY
jgi:hypothetical protein